MIEILWHGRGGQGAFTAARLLGAACSFADGRYALAFPSFGPERRGAPMRAFTKLDNRPVGDRSGISQADFVVYLDQTLFASGWESELKPGGKALVNTAERIDDPRVVTIDADGISTAVFGRPIPNTVFLAALSALSKDVHAQDVKEAIRQYMPAKLHDKNIAVVDQVCQMLANGVQEPAPQAVQEGAGQDVKGCGYAPDKPLRPIDQGRIMPRLVQALDLDPAVYARNTCWQAGHLVSKNAGWRQHRPVIDRTACTGCLVCYMDCPDGTIFKVDDAACPVAVDYDFCKGCGVCARSCRFDAIRMILEADALAAEGSVE